MAGVSTATVSRVINQTAWVEPVTRERVEKAMRDLNYRRNAAAIALAKRSGDMLGLLTGNLADPFFARLARGVEDVSRKQQYRLMVCSGGHDEEMEKAGLDFLVKVPAELFKDAYRRMGLDTKNLSRTIEDAGTVIEPLLPWTSAGVYMATTLGVSTLDLLPWAIQCYAAIFFALIYGFSGIGIARTAPASEKLPQSSVTE